MNTIIDKIRIDSRSSKPIYQQIAEQIQQLIATEQIRAGEHLPSVRHLGFLLDISPNTVARAYLELERKQVVVSKRGGGTIVTTGTDVHVMQEIRQKHLLDNVNEDIIKMLSQGYDPEELEAAFYTSLERWREERRVSIEVADTSQSITKRSKTIRIVGSHDIALNILVALFRQREKDMRIELTYVGSLGGLIALQEEKADLAGTHLLDEETGEYNIPFIKRVLPGRDIAVVNLVYRIQGLMFAAGNPKEIKGLADLRRPDITFINRQKGSGTRVLLDIQLKRNGIDSRDIRGYTTEMDTHLAIASAIAQREADSGLGIEAAARSCKLDFLPLFRERYDMVIPGPVYQSDLVAPLLRMISSKEFTRIVNKVDGYDTSQTGTTTFIT
jgi:molybdate-binding protein/DNA-binding transcriptional regulator YhcF (GntR family)